MKRLCIPAFLLLLLSEKGISQPLLPLLDSANTWSCFGDFFFQNVKYRLAGDTLANGRIYKKVMAHGSGIPFSFIPDSAVYKSCLREEAGKVMVIEKGFIAEHILYDFNKQAGDTIRFYRPSGNFNLGVLPGYVTGKVYKTDQITMFGITRKRLFIHDPFMVNQLPPQVLSQLDSQADVWIEGLGSRTGLFQRMPEWGIVGPQPYLLACVENNGALIYQNNTGYPADPGEPCFIIPEDGGTGEDTLITLLRNASTGALRLFPNPAADQFTIGPIENAGAVRLFDMTGKEVVLTNPSFYNGYVKAEITGLPSGIYQLVILRDKAIERMRMIKN